MLSLEAMAGRAIGIGTSFVVSTVIHTKLQTVKPEWYAQPTGTRKEVLSGYARQLGLVVAVGVVGGTVGGIAQQVVETGIGELRSTRDGQDDIFGMDE